MIDYMGTAESAVTHYTQGTEREPPLSLSFKGGDLSKEAEILSVRFADNKTTFSSDEPVAFVFEVQAHANIPNLRINTTVFNAEEVPVGSVSNTESLAIVKGERKRILFTLDGHHLAFGKYKTLFLREYVQSSYADKNDRIHSAITQWNVEWGSVMFKSSLKYLPDDEKLMD